MKKIAVLVEDNYEDMELWYPYYRLQEAGYAPIRVGSGRKKEYVSKYGYPAKEELSKDELTADHFAGVVAPGGFAPDKLRRDRKICAFIKACFDAGKPIAAICHGPWMLVSAGVLDGKRCTGSPGIMDDMVNAGGKFEDAEVVVDGKVVTSRSPQDLPAFMREYLKLLDSQ